MGNKSKSKKKSSRKKKKEKTKKPTKKKRKSRKRKASETDLSDSSEPEKKRPRFSQLVVKPTSVPPNNPNVRRSKRVKLPPQKWWASEGLEYQKEPLTYDQFKDEFEENGNIDNIVHHGIDYLNIDETLKRTYKQKKKSRRKKK